MRIIIKFGIQTGCMYVIDANFKEKNAHLSQDSNSGLQLYTLMLYHLSHPEELLDQARMFLRTQVSNFTH